MHRHESSSVPRLGLGLTLCSLARKFTGKKVLSAKVPLARKFRKPKRAQTCSLFARLFSTPKTSVRNNLILLLVYYTCKRAQLRNSRRLKCKKSCILMTWTLPLMIMLISMWRLHVYSTYMLHYVWRRNAKASMTVDGCWPKVMLPSVNDNGWNNITALQEDTLCEGRARVQQLKRPRLSSLGHGHVVMTSLSPYWNIYSVGQW